MYSKFIESDFTLDDIKSQDYWLYGSNFTKIIIDGTAKKIGKHILHNYSGIISAIIGNNVTSIEECAFSGCDNLASVTIGNGATSIGYGAFEFCAALTSVTMGNNITSIGDSAFMDCSSLAEMNLSNNIATIGKYAFKNCIFANITIPDSVTSIGESAFLGCFNLRRVDISDLSAWCKIDFADYYANPLHAKDMSWYDPSGAKLYINNSEATYISIPLDITTIKDYAFCGCISPSMVEIHENVTHIGSYAFYNCTKLNVVKCFPTTPPTIGSDVFYHNYQNLNTYALDIWVHLNSFADYRTAWSQYQSDISGRL